MIGIENGDSESVDLSSLLDGASFTSDQDEAITANTEKVGITAGQADAILVNTAKIGITSGQADAITTNAAKTGITTDQADAIKPKTPKPRTLQHKPTPSPPIQSTTEIHLDQPTP